MTRVADWPERLFAFLEKRAARPFEWGGNDCVLFAADAVEQMTGVDLAEEYRGRYSSAVGAARFLKKLGGVGALPGAVGLQEVPPLTARRGDVALVNQAGAGETLAIVVGAAVAGPGAAGVEYLPLDVAVRAWRVA